MNLPLPVAVAIMLTVGAAILALMWFGWRGRTRRSASLVGVLPSAPGALGAERTGPIPATYVSSTTTGDWLGRVAAADLGFRSAAVVQVFDAGVRIERGGAADVFVPADAVRGASLSPGMAGKYVGKDGLVVISWSTPAPDGSTTLLDTGLRTARADRSVLVAAVEAFAGTATPADDAHRATPSTSPGAPAGAPFPDSQNDPEESE